MDKKKVLPFGKRKKRIYCVNCGLPDHFYKQCQAPTTSFGLVAIRRYRAEKARCAIPTLEFECEKQVVHTDRVPPIEDSGFLVLLVQRKDTMGFIDFVRGKYPKNEPEKGEMLKVYLEEMTCEERHRLRTRSFSEIWDLLWLNHESKCYLTESELAEKKFSSLDIPALLEKTECRWSQSEWGFPKGRKNIHESQYQCAVREFCEETGYNKRQFRTLNDSFIEESFLGTNGVAYKHVYFIAEFLEKTPAPVLTQRPEQQCEVKNVGWFTPEQCLSILRPYDVQKKNVIQEVMNRYKSRY